MKEKIGIAFLLLGLLILMGEGESILVGLFLGMLGLVIFFLGTKFLGEKK